MSALVDKLRAIGVQCIRWQCDAIGPYRNTEAEAIEARNQRAPSTKGALTEGQILDIACSIQWGNDPLHNKNLINFARAIESHLTAPPLGDRPPETDADARELQQAYDACLPYAKRYETPLYTQPPEVREALNLPEPAMWRGTKLLPYEERWFSSRYRCERLGYTDNIKGFYSEEQMRAALSKGA